MTRTIGSRSRRVESASFKSASSESFTVFEIRSAAENYRARRPDQASAKLARFNDNTNMFIYA